MLLMIMAGMKKKRCNADESLSFPCFLFSLMVNLGPEVSNQVNCACIQFPSARCKRHCISLIDVLIS